MSCYYDPVTHRFINADCILDTSAELNGYNVFNYTANNPINNSDPSGHWIIKDAIKWITKNIVKPTVKTVKKIFTKIPITYSSGINLSGTTSIFSFNAQGGTTIYTKGNVAIQGILSGGFTTSSPGWSATSYQTVTNAPNIKKLDGEGYQLGGSVGVNVYGVPLSAGRDINIIPDKKIRIITD